MISKKLLEDLCAHMEWADATLWEAVKATSDAVADVEVKDRLFHIHFTQYAFLEAWRGKTFKRMKSEDFDTLADVYAWMRPYYADLREFLQTLDDETLKAPMHIPWAVYFGRQLGREVEMTTLGETLFQVCSHSIHHRAQVNVQLRQHGGEPPLIDYIIWLWCGRPGPEWDV